MLHSQASASSLRFKMKLHNRCLSNSIIFLLAILSTTSQAFTASTNLTDELTLLTFKSIISDPYNALSSWGNTTLHFCQWLGVSCGRKHPDRVTSLVLDSLDLSGNLPPHIANLTFLTNLRLSNSRFSGSIPNELGRLSRLTHLNLSFNYFDGEIPASLTHCTNLLTFDLLDNELSGVIPKDIGSLSQLKILNLGRNNLTGSIPTSFGNLSSLLGVSLQGNHLTGGIPSIDKLSDLQLIQFETNNLSGNLPSSIFNLSSLRVMSMGSNSLTGTLPPSMFTTLPQLQTLLLNTNQLEGHFPISLSNATNMEDLEIIKNSFTGTIPSMGTSSYFYWINLSENLFETKDPSDWDFLTSLTNCSYLVALGIELNNLGGTIPLSLGNLSTNLQTLLMGSNQITGSIPDVIGNLGNLTLLSLDDNLLTGSIPATIGRLQQLHVLSLIGNRLTGEIPYTIGNVTQLNQLYLNGNSLNGVIPESLGNCQNLEELNISQNSLTGSIPKELLMLSSLSTYLDLSYNLITGRLPVEVGQLTNLNALNVSYNKLSGELPETLGKCQSLEYLHMQHNFFSGAIPKSFSELKGLRLMDLSQNNLSGQIPEYMGRLKGLQFLNLSYNNLEGEVPDEGVFGITTSTVSVLGNKNLCGGIPNLHLPACHTQHLKKQHGSLVLKVVIPVLVLGSCLILAVVIIVNRRMKNQANKSSSTNLMEEQFRKVSYAELLKATDGFSQSNLIGSGSVGTVYKGILDSDENMVAVKVLNLQQRGASKSFMAECEVLRRSRHRNLVKILTLCSSTDFSGNDFKALVLEFMPNGSLEKWLHPVVSEHSELMTLTLKERMDIAIDVASALEYLHHHGEMPIVHCDLKPSNILLNSDMCAHVGDFGLARLIWDDLPGADEHQTVSIGLKGTIGYVAPEYGMGGQVSTYGDVYSYGILLLELFTGKAPTDELFVDALNLHEYVGMAFPEGVTDILDLRLHFLENDQDSKDNNRIKIDATMPEYACLVSVIEIGLACSNQDPRERMDMEDVNKALHTIRDSLLGFKRQG